MNNVQIAKNVAKETKQILAGLGHKVSLGHALELVSQLQNSESWNHLSALLKKPETKMEEAQVEVPAWDIEQGPMSDEQYVAKKGLYCPVCGSGQLDGGAFTVDAGEAFQEMGCNHCNSAWNDYYRLVGYGELEEGEIPEDDESEEEEAEHVLAGIDEKGVLRLLKNDWFGRFSDEEAFAYLKQHNRRLYELVAAYKALGKAGVDVCEDSDQPGQWLWMDGNEGSDISFDTEIESIWDAWSRLAGLAMGHNDLSSEDWDRLSIDQQVALVTELFSEE